MQRRDLLKYLSVLPLAGGAVGLAARAAAAPVEPGGATGAGVSAFTGAGVPAGAGAGGAPDAPAISDAEVEALIAERQAARKRRDFAASDRIRDQIAERGIVIEDSRDGGVRWKRK